MNNYLREKKIAERKVIGMERNDVRHHAATISPAPKDIARYEIESIAAGLDYYKACGITDIVLQLKHMGSYTCCYMSENIEDTKFFSRGGYLINHIDKDKLLEAVKPLHKFLICNGVTSACIETELMPWRALGDRLVTQQFDNYYNLHVDNLRYLHDTSLYSKLSQIAVSDGYHAYSANKESAKSHIKRQYEAIDMLLDGLLPDRYVYNKDIQKYKLQLDKYGVTAENYWLEPFNLVYYTRDGEKVLNTDNNFFHKHNLVINLTDFDNAIKQAYDYKEKYKDAEGIMIKPLQSRILGIPHALKVRNNDYLQLIYGINFHRDYEYYLTKRRVDRKIKASIRDYEIHCALTVAESASDRRNLYFAALSQEEYEKTLDVRL